MNSTSFGPLTGGMGLGMRMGMPRLSTGNRGRGLGVPSLGGLQLMRFAKGGYAGATHPSMSWLAVRDGMASVPNRAMPDYMLSRMADGGEVLGPMDPLDYPRRALDRQGQDLRLARDELSDRPIRQSQAQSRPPGWEPHHTFTQRGRIDQTLEQLLADRERAQGDDTGPFMDPSSVPMMLANPKRVPMKAFLGSMALPDEYGEAAGTALSGPAMGGLSALLHSGNAYAPPTRPDRREKFDWRAIEEMGRRNPYPTDLRSLLSRLLR